MITSFAITLTCSLIWFSIGFIIGSRKERQVYETVDRAFSDLKKKKVGVATRPTAQQLHVKNDPLAKETDEAMRQTLEELQIGR